LLRFLLSIACLLTLLTTLTASFVNSAQARSAITGARAGETGNATRFVLDLSESVPFRIYTLADPYRLVLDIEGASWALDATQLTLDRGLVGALRYGQFQSETARIVVDLKAPATVNQAFILPPGTSPHYRLVIDLGETAGASFHPATLSSVEAARAAPAAPESAAPEEADVQTATAVAHGIPLPAPPRPKAKKRPGEWLIVIDPGHGGADPGAIGSDGSYEKHITLAAAKVLEIMLAGRGYKVLLSRRTDKYLSLAARVEYAQSRKADLFISLHADRHESAKVRGASIYTLSEQASDAEAAALAARENDVDTLFGVDGTEHYEEDVRQILISLVQRTTMTCSAKFAGTLIPELEKTTKLLGRTHRFAGFRVLKAPDVPSVLVEMGYMSNGQDRKMLSSKKGRHALMLRVAEAVDMYFARHAACSQAS
jgi:N-acetylmuramoyl-L-alanine amidase